MEQERLDKEEPERDRKHRPHRQREKCSCARVAENREGGEAECAEISQSSESRHRDAGDFGVNAAQNPETVRRSSADSGLAGEVLHGQVSCLRQPGQ